MRKRPLLLLACVFVAGLCFGKYKIWYFPMAAAILSGYGCFRLFRQKKWGRMAGRSLWLLAAFFLAMMHMYAALSFREQELSRIKDGDTVIIQGEIYKKECQNEQCRFYLKAVSAVLSDQSIACNQVMLFLADDSYSIGETLILQGKVKMHTKAANEGGFDAETFYFSQKIDFSLQNARVLSSSGKEDRIAEELYRLRLRLGNIYAQALKPEHAGVLSVMLLGERSGLDAEKKALYQSSGISHILAISGLHVSLIGMVFYRFLRKRGIRYAPAFGMACIFLFLYASMTGNSVSTRRAVGMLVVLMAGEMLGRSYDSLNALGFMAVVLLLENPFLLEYAGFQFSFAAVFGAAVTGKCLRRVPKEKEEQTRMGKIRNLLYSALGIWLATLPLTACYYYEIPLYSIFVNLLVLPLLHLVFAFGIFGAIVGLAFLPGAKILLLPCGWILGIYDFLAALSLRLPMAQVIVGIPSARKIFVYYLLLAGMCAFLYWKKQGGRLWFLWVLPMLWIFFHVPKRAFELDVLDVGQGDGIYLCTQGGISLFVDGGSSSVGNVGTYRILPFLKAKGISHISYWFVSHADMDHISGLNEILESGYEVDVLVAAKAAAKDEAFCELIELAEAAGTQIVMLETGDTLEFADSKIECIYPDGGQTGADRNELSLVLLYQDEDFTGIFTGDISSAVEKKLAEGGKCVDVVFYKAAHHGSKYSNSELFLQKLQPEIAVVSCGKGNSYGHPSEEALLNMEEAGAEIFQTMEQGQICITKGKDGQICVTPFFP